MKIRHPLLIKATGLAGACVAGLWMATLRYRFRSLGDDVHPHRPGLEGRYIYAYWHENLLLPGYCFGRRQIHILISEHGDGQIGGEMSRHMGFQVVLGSSTRGGIQAVRQLIRHSYTSHLAITPDGPRGPRRQVQPGLIYLASRTGLPIVPTGVGFDHPWRLRTWDRLAVPKPGSLATCVTAPPILVPPNASKRQLAVYRQQVEDALTQASHLAEPWAETGSWVAPDAPHRPLPLRIAG